MDRAKNNVHILIFSNTKEDKSRYSKTITSIRGIQNSMARPSTITYSERKQEWKQNLEELFDAADIILLLVSLVFVGSEHYQEEVELALQKHRQGSSKVIPVLLSPAMWEESGLGELTPLPSDRVPISEYSSADKAVNDVAHALRQVIRQILKDRGCIEEQDEDNAEPDDASISSTAFNWTDSISPFNYLTFSGKNQDVGISQLSRLRMVMRFFYEHQRVSYDLLSEQDIREAVQQKSNSEYSLQDCQKDLKYLATHFNLVRIDDMSSIAHSIPALDAILNNKFYQATSDGLGIEHLIEDRMQSNRGRLSKSDLRFVKRLLIEIDEYIADTELKESDLDEIADKWSSAFETWEKIIASSRDYFSTLERSAQYRQYDFVKYMEYKNIVVLYVQSFASVLLDISQEINALFSGWSHKKDLLVRAVAQSKYKKDPDLEKKPSLEETLELISHQMTSLEKWFKEVAPLFYERAGSEIQRLVNRATSFALYRRSHVNNVTALSELALQFMHIRSFESAQQVFDAAFAHALSLHFGENLMGHEQIYGQAEEMSSVWDEPPPARLSLVPVKQGNASASIRKLEDPMYEDKQAAHKLQVEEIQGDADRQQRFAHLFAQCVLNLASFVSIDMDPLDRIILEEIIDACLNHPTNQHLDETGSTVLLLNPCEQMYMRLRSLDGVLFLPCYQLKLQSLSSD